uniref:Recep_L_domain domain-containing protein n=1 Tax=Globodera pallida TaxID=36090 RepID=A0A183BJ36_GLOPA
MRDDGGGADLNAHVKSVLSNIGNGCLCNGTAILIQQSIKTNFVAGAISVHLMRASLSMESPLTTNECVEFSGLLYNGALNMSMELTSEGVLCNLVNGNCETRQPYSNKTDRINCAYCRLVHKKAYTISDRFSQLFNAFSIMCKRMSDEKDKKHCIKHVNLLTHQIKGG